MCAKRINEMTLEEEKRAAELYKKAIVIEGLSYAPTLSNPGDYMAKIKKGGVTATHMTVVTNDAKSREALRTIVGWHKMAEQCGFKLVETADDIINAKANDETCIIMGSQESKIIEDDLCLVSVYQKLGLRVIQLAYDGQTYIGSGGEDTDGGVTAFGKEVIDEMNHVGILVDVSHCGDKTVMDAIEYSKKPIAITHANPRALVNRQRNKTDEMIIACAEKGGVIGLTAWTPTAMTKKGVRPTVEDFIDFIEYVVKLAGIDHVSFGLDLNPGWEYDRSGYDAWAKLYPTLAPAKFEERLIEGLEDVTDVINVARGLVARGYSDEDIYKILGQNLIELYKKVWV